MKSGSLFKPGEVQNISDEDLVKVLADRGLTSPLQTIETKPAAARLAAEKIGFPVALKIISDEISHKTEAGGVVLNLLDGIAVENAANAPQAMPNPGMNIGSASVVLCENIPIASILSINDSNCSRIILLSSSET